MLAKARRSESERLEEREASASRACVCVSLIHQLFSPLHPLVLLPLATPVSLRDTSILLPSLPAPPFSRRENAASLCAREEVARIEGNEERGIVRACLVCVR